MIVLVMLISVLSLGFAVFLARQVLAADTGTPQMQDIAAAIKEGAEAFLRRQNRTIAVIGLGVAALIFILYAAVRPHNPNDPTTTFNMAIATTLVGKVEAGIPEDDPRNPAVIADLVGDNVGDCAGRGADLFESTAAENIGAMILGSGLAVSAAKAGIHFTEGMLGVMLFPLVARAFGLVASIIGIMAVRTDEDEDPMQALNRGYYVAALLAVGGFAAATRWLLHAPEQPGAWLRF